MPATRSLRILIIEDDPDFREMSAQYLKRRNHSVEAVASGADALSTCATHEFDVAILDMNMPGLNGLEVLDRLRDVQPGLQVLMLTGQGSIETAVQAIKLGAHDYLTKPFPLPELEQRCLLSIEQSELRKENRQLKSYLARQQTPVEMVGNSAEMKAVRRLIARVAETDKTVLISGESGTGKELVARAVHQHSSRADRPMVTINCAALPEQLVESELFGHEKGAFTGATAEQPGLFEIADRGTLFIDELGELPLALQPKLLRVLEDGSLRRVGSPMERRVDVRVITATNRDLSAEVNTGRFREDLFYRINVLTIDLPPLRERGDDVWELVDLRLAGKAVLSENARAVIERYDWPGNVRQLINALDRAIVLAEDGVIVAEDFPREVLNGCAESTRVTPRSSNTESVDNKDLTLSDRERMAVIDAMTLSQGNKTRAARHLGINRRKLYRLLEKHSLSGQSEGER